MELRGIRVVYGKGEGSCVALDGIDVAFPSKGFFAVYGASGSGKSTLLSVLSLFEKAEGSLIDRRGIDLLRMGRRKKEDYLLREVGFLPQHFDLLEEESAAFNVALPLMMAGNRKRKAAAMARSALGRLGLSSSAGKRVSLLSGGEKARVALARALAKGPSVLLGDEPTGNLDEANAAMTMSVLKEEGKKRLVIIVSHDESLSRRYVDGYIRLSDGKVVENRLPACQGGEVAGKKGKRASRSSAFLISPLLRGVGKNIGKMALTFASSLLSTALFSFVVAFDGGAAASVERESLLSLSYLSMGLSKEETVEGNGLITLTKSRRPSEEETESVLDGEKGATAEIDLSYYLPSSLPVRVNGFPVDEVSLCPVPSFASLSSALWKDRVDGEIPSGNPLSYCVVNREFSSFIGEAALGKTVLIERDIHLEQDDLTEDFAIRLSFVVSAVVDEFSFLSVPRIYYCYDALAGMLSNVEFATMAGNPYSLVAEADDGSPLSSYRRLLFFPSSEIAASFYERKRDTPGFSLSSEAALSAEAFSSLSGAFILVLEPFLLSVILAGCFLIGLLSYSSFLARKREFAIFSSLGARRGDIMLASALPSAVFSLFGAGASLALSPIVLSLGRAYFLSKAGMGMLAPRLPLPAFPLAIIIHFFLPLLSGIVPLAFGSLRSLRKELSEQ